MPEKNSYAQCLVHRGVSVDIRLLHEHHVHPQGYGGDDIPENRVWLCGSCHDLVHRLAHQIKSKKTGQATDLAYQYQAAQNLSPSARERLLNLASVVAVAMETYIPDMDDDMEGGEEDMVMVQLTLPRSIHARAKVLASSYTNPKSGRPMGLYRYLERVVMNHVHRASNAPGLAANQDRFFGVDSKVEAEPQKPEAESHTGLTPIF